MENYMENMKTVICETRKKLELTQEQLAEQLGISYQAVSKWENGIACPDIMMLPKLAKIFDITIDALFGIEDEVVSELEPEHEVEAIVITDESKEDLGQSSQGIVLPWEDDGMIHAVAFLGHKLLKDDDQMNKECRIKITGRVLNVHANINVDCEDVEGYVIAGEAVDCEAVGGNVTAGSSVDCECIEGDVIAGSSVQCEGIEGNVSAGSSVDCDNVGGNVSAGTSVSCEDVSGSISAGGNVNC